MLVILGNKDLTKYVLSDSYDIQLTRKFEEWTDANYKSIEFILLTRFLVHLD